MEEDSKEYVVKGDGPCFLRTAAAHTLGDENNGLGLSRDLNTHKSGYRNYYKDKISADFPLNITVGVKGEFKVFENADEYFDWLMESKRSTYMWRGCVDAIALSNMMNIDIDILIHEEGKNPEIKSYKPDPEFPWKQDDLMRMLTVNKIKQGKMVVLNWKNTHFNLIVGPQHMLSQVGSISHQVQENQADPGQLLESGQPRRKELMKEAAKTQVGSSPPSPQVLEASTAGREDLPNGDCGELGTTRKENIDRNDISAAKDLQEKEINKKSENHEGCKLKLLGKDNEKRGLKAKYIP